MEIPKTIHESWHKYLQPLFDDPKMQKIRDSVLSGIIFYPESDNIFRVFSMPLESIKVVILGQDPYPNGEAIGLAFAVNEDTNLPASLRVIHKEVENSLETTHPTTKVDKTKWKTLKHWHEQGVFLLNTALTVERKQAGSHLQYWEWFIREVVKIISEQVKPIWLLWGAKAQGFKDIIVDKYEVQCIDTNDIIVASGLINSNLILTAPHPAAELYGGKQKFTGCGHFVKTNELLELRKQEKINW